jgi:hypothetical protein
MIRWNRIPWFWAVPVILVGGVVLSFTRWGSSAFSRLAWISVGVAPVFLIINRAVRGVRVSIWNIATYTLALYATVAILDGSYRWYTKAILALVVLLPLQSIANATDRADWRRSQKRRDIAATRLNDLIAYDVADVERYAVYLRPFASTDRLEAQSQGDSLDRPGDIPVHLDLESVLTQAFRKTCPLVALGRQGETYEGAGRIEVSDDDWQNAVVKLSDRASVLVIIPSAHLGTLWELNRLAKDPQLARTLFIMPELPRKTPSGVIRSTTNDRLFDSGILTYDSSEHTYDIPQDWESARAKAEPFGLHLPAYCAAGAFFTIAPASGDVNQIVPLALSILARRSLYIRSTVCQLGLWPWLAPRRTSTADDFEAATFGGGRTLEYALVVAADAYLTWGRTTEGMEFLRRAFSVCRRPKWSFNYAQNAGLLGEQSKLKGTAVEK